MVDLAAEETAFVSGENIIISNGPGVVGADRIDDRRTVATAERALDVGLGKEEFEIEILGEALNETIALGKAGPPGKDGPQLAVPNTGDRRDDSHGVPILLHERWMDTEIGRNRLEKLVVR